MCPFATFFSVPKVGKETKKAVFPVHSCSELGTPASDAASVQLWFCEGWVGSFSNLLIFEVPAGTMLVPYRHTLFVRYRHRPQIKEYICLSNHVLSGSSNLNNLSMTVHGAIWFPLSLFPMHFVSILVSGNRNNFFFVPVFVSREIRVVNISCFHFCFR